MNDFLIFFDERKRYIPMHLEICYSKMCDYSIYIYKKGCGKDGEDLTIVYVESNDLQLCFAKAHVEFKEWLLENEGGY